MNLKLPPHMLALKPYVPGKPMEELERELGISDSIKLASNENPLGPSPRAVEAIARSLAKLNRYPDGGGYVLTQKLAGFLGSGPENIVLGNGSDEILGILAQTLLQPGDEAVLPEPSFLMYDLAVRSAGGKSVPVPLKSMAIDLDTVYRHISAKTRLVFLCHPNNPTGSVISTREFARFIDRVPDHIVVVVDEAYIEFVRDAAALRSLDFHRPDRMLVTLRTFSKVYGLAGLRIGYGVMPAALAQLLNRVRMPFNVNSLAQAGAMAALDDVDFVERTINLVHSELDCLYQTLEGHNVAFFPTQANFFLIDLKRDADEVFRKMLRQGVIVRSMSGYGYPRFIRVNVGLPDENQRFINTLIKVLQPG